MVQLVYFDNSIVRKLIDKPDSWDIFYDEFINKFGNYTKPIDSYYLFFEYFELHKRNFRKPSETVLKKIKEIATEEEAVKKIDKIGFALDQYFDEAYNDILVQLYSSKIRKFLFNKIIKRRKYESSFEVSIQLKDILFKNILDLFFCDYQTFARRAAMYLAWDFFCDLEVKIFIKKALLGIWSQLLEKNIFLPFGKIIDDIPEFHQILPSKNTMFKGSEDMVDSEAIMYVLIGLINNTGDYERINLVTFDFPINVNERIEMGINSILKVENIKKIFLPRYSGKVFCFNREKFHLEEIIDVSITVHV